MDAVLGLTVSGGSDSQTCLLSVAGAGVTPSVCELVPVAAAADCSGILRQAGAMPGGR